MRYRRTGATAIAALFAALVSTVFAPARHIPSASFCPREKNRASEQGDALCCCAHYAHGWEHAWLPVSACAARGGACVTHDRCTR